jgi:F420-dependent oxidoreductase-like protein
VRLGVAAPQGWMAEYAGWDAAAAWERLARIGQQVDQLGFDSMWVVDHFLTNDDRDNAAPTFESFAVVTALAALTRRVRIGHAVICVGYRNPALTAKAISTADVISGGRVELGIGAGWNESEYRSYGYEFPDVRTRLEILRESLEVIGPLLTSGRATFSGRHVHAENSINSPAGLQHPRIPIVVGGNGPNVTWRLAAKYADELNLDGMSPAQTAEALPVIKSRCEELGRDPKSLRVSVNLWSEVSAMEGAARVSLIQEFRDLGISRLIFQLLDAVTSDEPLLRLVDDATAAGIRLSPSE